MASLITNTPDGTATIRMSDSIPIRANVTCAVGKTIASATGTIKIYDNSDGSTLLDTVSVTNIEFPIGRTASAFFLTAPVSLGMTAGGVYNFVFKISVTIGSTVSTKTIWCQVTVLADEEET